MPQALQDPAAGLTGFLAPLPHDDAVRLRTLAHAWEGGGGTLSVGRLAVRLMAAGRAGPAFTAATLHRAHGDPPRPALEIGRVLLQGHGVGPEEWTAWCDERPELRDRGFSGDAKFPLVRLDGLGDAELARLALGLRDLARLASPPAPPAPSR